MIRIAIARNGRERLFKTFPFWNDDAELIMDELHKRDIPAVAAWVTEYEIRFISWTNSYREHSA